ncbi:tetratricopeptide repeat protein [Novipirellula sp. SH528]|uniref:tetratricopeptide repeat protein n=1 Tax=Novipirellula sp. SH528 TaxID=3454466 RepID=UPI003FA04427
MVFQQRVGIAIPFVLVSLTLSMGDFAPTLVAQEVAVADDITATQGKSGNAGKADAAKTDSAVGAGKSEFDEAVVKRIDAESPEQLAAVSTLLESALAKGLNNENKSFAEKMLASVLVQRSQQLVALMQRVRGRRMLQIRDEALEFLRKATKSDESLVEAYLMIAQLNLLPEGNRDEMAEATSKAIELLKDEPIQQSRAYVLRAVAQEDDEKKMADLNSAIEADSTNIEALQARAGLRMQSDDVDGAMADLEKILAVDPGNQVVAQAAVQQLLDAERVDDAVDLITKTLAAKPSEGMYRMRAILYRMQGKEDEAFADLNKALAMQPKDPISLLQRAEIALSRGDIRAAKRDLKSAMGIAPQIADAEQTIVVRVLIAVEEGRMADAISDMKSLVDRDPTSIMRQLQLANLYLRDDRPRQAIETLSAVLDRDPKNASVLRSRADALLSVGEHADAVADYERAAKVADEDSVELPGILNNLAWVLATSPNDELRDGERAVKYGKRAAELTEFKEAHILSTLAAGYAESGDFEKAIQWSSKAVELGEKDVELGENEESVQINQLKQELENYRNNKPWREKQEVEENKVPILSPEDLIDT